MDTKFSALIRRAEPEQQFRFEPAADISGKDLARLAIGLLLASHGVEPDMDLNVTKGYVEKFPADLQCHFRALDS